MRRLLVTGGAGFIGANFVHYWLHEHPGDRVVVLDVLTYAGNPCNLLPLQRPPGFRFVRGDICDGALVETLLRAENIDTLVHFAAESHVDRSITGPDAFIDTNVIGTHSLLKAARKVVAGRCRRSGASLSPCVHRRSVWLARNPRPGVHGNHCLRTQLAVLGQQGGVRSPGARVSPHLRTAGHDQQLLEQLRPVHFPEKLIPLCIVNILRGLPLPIYGDGKTCATGCT